MKKIHINLGSDSYDVHIESGLIDKAGSAIADLTGAEKAAVITEDTIDKLYGMRLVSSLEKAGIKAKMIVVPGTEKSRSLPIVNSIYGALADFGLGNDDILIALGGRIVGDVTGFAAATWHRGVRYIQFPTSVLSQIGSAIGGKVTAGDDFLEMQHVDKFTGGEVDPCNDHRIVMAAARAATSTTDLAKL